MLIFQFIDSLLLNFQKLYFSIYTIIVIKCPYSDFKIITLLLLENWNVSFIYISFCS
jgi:hypothetical protein